MKKYSATTILLFLIASIFFLQNTSFLYADEKMYPGVNTSFPTETIRSLNESIEKSGNYNVHGYVVFIYRCLPCPADHFCKPCQLDNIVISEENKTLEGYYLSSSDMVIYTNNSTNYREFTVGKRYQFSINVKPLEEGAKGKSATLIGYWEEPKN